MGLFFSRRKKLLIMFIKTKKLLIIAAMCLQIVMLQAQTVKNITVSQTESYTDHLSMKNDSKDMDLMVKFVFNEEMNTLTVSVISYRTLFVFWDNTRYKGVIKSRKIHPDKLPYVVSNNTSDHFKLTNSFCNSLPQPHHKYIFKKWVEVDGIQPVDNEIKMVNDYIEQTFNIQGKRSNVTVTLHDVMLMDLVKQKGLSRYYEIPYGKDLNTKYQVTIQRNPCFGHDEEVSAAQNSLAAIQKSYAAFKKTYSSGKVSDEGALKTFKDLQATLVAQFPKNTDSSACPDIQQARDQYNFIADSIQNLKVVMETTSADVLAALGGEEGKALNAKLILSNARQLDNTVALWLVSKDDTERADLVEQGRDLIKDTSAMIGGGHGRTPEEQNAVSLFRKAEQYFNKVCK